MDEIVRFLAEHPPWRDLPRDRVAEVAGRLQIEYFARGARLLSAGGLPSGALVVIRSGSIDLVHKGRGGDELLDRLGEGEAVDVELGLQEDEIVGP